MSLRALIIEDDPAWQLILQELLHGLGFEVDVAANFKDGIRTMRRLSHRLAIVDLCLQEDNHRNSDGLLALEAIGKHDPGCQTILLTGHATVELAVQAIKEYGALTCLQKETFSRGEFRQIIHDNVLVAAERLSPAAPTEQSGQAQKARNLAQASGSRQSIGLALVVDDDAGWRDVLAEMLEELDYRVHRCGSYGEAIGRLNRDQYDLAVVDLELTAALQSGEIRQSSAADDPKHKFGGFRLLASMRASGLPTIVVTGLASLEAIENTYRDYGAYACIQKQNFDRKSFAALALEAPRSVTEGPVLDKLTGRERQVLNLLVGGMTNKEIADTMMISTNTVKRHLKAVFRKMGVSNRASAIALAHQLGLQLN